MAGRPRTVSDETIFRAVTAVVSEVGPSGLTLSAVADKAGLSPPALTQRFGSKRNLLLAYAAASAVGVDDLFEEAKKASADPLATVRRALLAFTAPVATRSALANSLAFLHLDLTDPQLGVHAAEQSRLLRRRIADLLQEANESGQLADVDAVALADTIYTTYNGALVTWAIDGRGSLAHWVSERLDSVLAPHLAGQD